MRKILIVLLVLLSACKDDNPPDPDNFKPDFLNYKYTAYVNVNGSDVLKYIKATKSLNDTSPSRFGLTMNSTDAWYNYYYPISISISSDESGTYRLHSLETPGGFTNIDYSKLCCYSNPDEIHWSLVIDEADSLNNYVRIHVDSVTDTLSGMFMATMVQFIPNSFVGPDTVRLRCDTFYCTYSIH